MKDFLVFNAECINQNADSVYRIVANPVKNGVVGDSYIFYMNPEAPFERTSSGITEKEVCAFPPFSSRIQEFLELKNFHDVWVSTADGYSARALFNTMMRLGVKFDKIEYLNAKAIVRKCRPDLVSMSFDFLNNHFFGDPLGPEDLESVPFRWAKILSEVLKDAEEPDLRTFAQNKNLRLGFLQMSGFLPSITKKDYSARNTLVFDPSDIEVSADESHPLFGKTVVFTGKLESLKRDEARSIVVSKGGFAPEGVTKDTDLLVVGVQDLRIVGEKGLSGKMKKAFSMREKGSDIEIIDENDFFELVYYK